MTLFTIVVLPGMGWLMGKVGKKLKRQSLEAQGRAYTISRFSTELKNFLDEKLGGEYVASVVTMGQGLTVTIKRCV